jgi:hypothetical protein
VLLENLLELEIMQQPIPVAVVAVAVELRQTQAVLAVQELLL